MTRLSLGLVMLALVALLPRVGAAQSAAVKAQVPIGDCDEACVRINIPGHEGYGCVSNGTPTGQGGCSATASYCHITNCSGVAILERDGQFRGLITRCDGSALNAISFVKRQGSQHPDTVFRPEATTSAVALVAST